MNDWQEKFGFAPGFLTPLTDQLQALGCPPETLSLLERLLDKLKESGKTDWLPEDDSGQQALARLAFSAPFLVRRFINFPEPLKQLQMLEKQEQLPLWNEWMGNLTEGDENGIMRALRHWKYAAFTRITARDLMAFQSPAETCAQISLVAESMIQAAYRFSFCMGVQRHGLPLNDSGELVLGSVIAMGKLGGGELNYSSDVDLIFFHEGEEHPVAPLAEKAIIPGLGESWLVGEDYWNHWRKVAKEHRVPGGKAGKTGKIGTGEFFNQQARQIIRLLSTTMPEGLGWRVDVDLRPLGKSGQLAPSLGFMMQYYDIQGREWERVALIKARPVAGCPSVYQKFADEIHPFVYRRYLDYHAVEGIALVKHDINRVHRGVMEANVKLGRGGIRESEFMIQALQLLYGGKKPDITAQNHQQAIEKLKTEKIISPEEAEGALADYWLLRQVENRIQMLDEAQTQILPDDSGLKRRIFTDFAPEDEARISEAENILEQTRDRVEERFNSLFSEMGQEEYPPPEVWQGVIKKHLGEEQTKTFLPRIDSLISTLMKTRSGERVVFKMGRLLTREALYRAGTQNAFPRWMEFFEQIGNRNAIYTLIEANPGVLNWVSLLFTEGGHLAHPLIRHPGFLESFVSILPQSEEDLDQVFLPVLNRGLDEEEFILEVQQVHAQMLLYILSVYLKDTEANIHRKMLSDLARVTVSATLRYAWQIVTEKMGIPEGTSEQNPGFTVLAMGKLGSQEMRFGSDLDLVFLFEGDGTTSKGKTHYEFYTRLTQRLNNLLTAPTQFGKLYEIDHRLRPFGNRGLLVSSLAQFQSFLAEAEVWNFQAFTRINFLCGDESLAENTINSIAKAWAERKLPKKEVAEKVWEMLGRLVEEHGSKKPHVLPLKFGVGALIGVEFLRQYFFLTGQQGTGQQGTWQALEEPPELKALKEKYDILGEVDERASLFSQPFAHEIRESDLTEMDALKKRWNFTEIQTLQKSLETSVKSIFETELKD